HPARADTDGGGEGDGSEVAARRDPHQPLDDVVEVRFDGPGAGVRMLDGAGREWLATPLGGLSAADGLIDLGFLEVDRGFFLAQGGTLTQGGQSLTFEGGVFPEMGTLKVSRSVHVSRARPLLRWIEVLENPDGAERTVDLALLGRIFSDAEPEVLATGSGDRIVDRSDAEYLARIQLGGETLYLARHIGGGDSPARPKSAVFSLGTELFGYSLKVPARAKLGLLHFAALGANREEVEAMLELCRRLDAAALEGLAEADLMVVANRRIDRDGDGLDDPYELANGLDPRDAADAGLDPDGDGLANREEHGLGTSPRNADTDGDGIADGVEARERGTDPRQRDTDGDGIDDGRDPLPLVRLLVRGREVHRGIVGEATRVRIRLEQAGRRPLPPEVAALKDLTLGLRFGARVELVGAVAGEVVERGPGDSALFRAAGGWLIVDVRSAVEGVIPIHVEDRALLGISGSAGVLQLLAADGDPDGDGLPSRFEIRQGTDPRTADSDGDGLPDRIETGSGVLLSGVEVGTFPWAADSDGGGSRDREELLAGLDPLDPADDLLPQPLPVALQGAAGAWRVLPSWLVTGVGANAAAIDNAAILRVNGLPAPAQARGRSALGGSEAVLGPVGHGGLRVSRRIFAHPALPL
ncbi:MAG: hypothetical protein ACRD2T_12010, partial [Thermoanaerobaculia bacterium]